MCDVTKIFLHISMYPCYCSLAECSPWRARSKRANTTEWVTLLNQSVSEFRIRLVRRHQYYLVNLIAPTLLTTTVAFFTPLIPPEGGMKFYF